MKTNTISTTTNSIAIAITAIGTGIVALVVSWVSSRFGWRSVTHGVRVGQVVVPERLRLGLAMPLVRLGLAMSLAPAMADVATKRCRPSRKA